jgi:glycosyltransferase involved in cell wall biosynthesis
MRVLLAVHHFPPNFTGGAEWRAYRTADALQCRGHQVRVLSVESIKHHRGDPRWRDEVYEGVQVRRLFLDLDGASDPWRVEFDNPWIGKHLSAWLATLQPDVFHLIGGYLLSGSALRAARSMEIPSIVTLTDYWFLCPRITMLRSDGTRSRLPIDPVTCAQCLGQERRRYALPNAVAPKLMRAFWGFRKNRARRIEERQRYLMNELNGVHTLIAPSRFLMEQFVRAGVSQDSIRFMRQGHDFSYLNDGLLRKEPSERLRVGYIGQISFHKGVHTLLLAAARVDNPNLEIRIYGDGSRFPRYMKSLRRFKQSRTSVEFAGSFAGRTQLTRILQTLDVVVVPSVWAENSPNSVLEAFAHRTPVIASNTGGLPELVDHGRNGLLFEAGDAGSLAGALDRILVSPELLETMRANIRPVKSLDEEIDELGRVYQAALAAPSSD